MVKRRHYVIPAVLFLLGAGPATLSPVERKAAFKASGGYKYPKSQTPWQEIQRSMVAQFDEGMVLKPAVEFKDVAHVSPVPRDNH